MADEWTMKTWYIYPVEYYSAIKNENLSFVATCIELEGHYVK
jgi:hypothetical protein